MENKTKRKSNATDTFLRIIKSKTVFILFNFLLAGIVAVLLFFGVFWWTKSYTHHGDEVVVPSIVGYQVNKAQVILETQGLHLQIIDTVYTDRVDTGAIVEQTPLAGTHVKRGRTIPIYVTQNAPIKERTLMPDVLDMSVEQATSALRRQKLQVDSIAYEPSEYNGLVLDAQLNGESVSENTKLIVGTKIVLIVGANGLGEEIEMPYLKNLTLEEARQVILANKLVLGAVEGDEGFVYKQVPAAGQIVLTGQHIDLYLSADLELFTNLEQDDEEDEEDFF